MNIYSIFQAKQTLFEKWKNFSTFSYVWDFLIIVIDTRLFSKETRSSNNKDFN